MSEDQAPATKEKTLVGRVVSNKMTNTVSVLIEERSPHPVYRKYVRRSTKLLAHDADNSCNEGDVVAIAECRPISKHKSWRVTQVLETASAE